MCAVGAALIHADRQTHRKTYLPKIIGAFRDKEPCIKTTKIYKMYSGFRSEIQAGYLMTSVICIRHVIVSRFSNCARSSP